ncbi:pilus assembly protein TadG-related protein [Streptomyces sp. NPDC048383]|uniref:pilus assembly protein TadG-related protein n=1 Tax=Streptomyces sp. NPDC048383 TaxID=3155386 RepID=UPI0034318750
MTRIRRCDRGQVFPLYAVAVVALVFAALVFFVFGQAAVVRSDAQGAADAAALAAGREARDSLDPSLDLALLKPQDWRDLLKGGAFDGTLACGAAEEFAQRNDATASCARSTLRFTVEVTTNGTVGSSVVPGTDGMHAKANATAEVVPRCELGSAPSGPATASPGTATPTTPDPAVTGPTPSPSVVFKCRGGVTVRFDPMNPDPWKALARSLFDVRLVS